MTMINLALFLDELLSLPVRRLLSQQDVDN